MDKIDFRELAQKVKANADDGIKKVGVAAQKAAAGINDGLDSAKESLRKSSIAKNAVKELQTGIKELEEENKAKAQDTIHKETDIIIEQLKDLLQAVKRDPENSGETIDSLAEEYRSKISSMVSDIPEGDDLMIVQAMSIRYEDALRACLQAKTALEKAISQS